MNYVILAAGEGSRFLREGIETPKPMIPILGEPMIGRLIHLLMQCNPERIIIVSNSRKEKLTEYLTELKTKESLPLDIKPIVSHSSYYSLLKATESLKGNFIAMTVDTIFSPSEFFRFSAEAENIKEDEILMGLTSFVDDESPLYADVDENGMIVNYRYGGEPFPGKTFVSAGIYGLTEKAMAHIKNRAVPPESLSDFQRILAAETDIKVKVFEFSKAMDVDSLHDKEVAEHFLLSLMPGS